MNEKQRFEDQANDLKMIRQMMERSSKFLSLSGLSGVLAGTFALCGAAFAWFYIPSYQDSYNNISSIDRIPLIIDAIIVLVFSLGSGVWLSFCKAKKRGEKFFSKIAILAIYNFTLPLIAGGVFSLIYLFRGDIQTAISATLIFYGLALVNVSKFTYSDIHHLGIAEITLGLLSVIFPYNGLIFWAIGFGACHILYGLIMHFKYDTKQS